MNIKNLQSYWVTFLASPSGANAPAEPYNAEPFGDSPDLADRLGRLVLEGIKTATCSAVCGYEFENEPLPTVGTRMIMLDGHDVPICILETTEVEIRPFSDIDAQFAWEEGEDDRTLKSWRIAHWDFFTRSLPEIGLQPTEDMLLVCERFSCGVSVVIGLIRTLSNPLSPGTIPPWTATNRIQQKIPRKILTPRQTWSSGRSLIPSRSLFRFW